MNYESLIGAQKIMTAELLHRLDRLETYLLVDPSNASLLVEVFETALNLCLWDRALFHMRHGQALDPGSLAWSLRESDFWLVQKRHDEALDVLLRLEALAPLPASLADAVLHNFALIDFQTKNYAKCVSRLESRMQACSTNAGPMEEIDPTKTFSRSLAQLWLRALHHAGEVSRAIQWILHLSPVQHLHADVGSVASLIALDAQRFDLAREWSETVLFRASPGDRPMEALVTQASLSLAMHDAVKAREFAFAALQINPHDGRSWSVYAFADLLAGDPAIASRNFKTALDALPSHIGTWHGLGWSQLIQRQLASARDSFEAALALDRNFAESHGGLAVVLALENNVQSAHFHVERALRLDPGSLTGRFAQAMLCGEISSPHAFEELVRRLLPKLHLILPPTG